MTTDYAGTFDEIRDPPGGGERSPSVGNGADRSPLPYVNITADLKPREWHVLDRIPTHNVTLLTGEGAAGKSTLAMQLAGSTVLNRLWLGLPTAQGPALYISCEEDDDEICRRLDDVARHLESTRQEMHDLGLRVLSFAGIEARSISGLELGLREIGMTKSDETTGHYFSAPEPPTDSEEEGMEWGRALARRYLPSDVKLAAAIAFGDSNATAWTRLQAARLIAQIAGAIPEAMPDASQPGGDGAHA